MENLLLRPAVFAGHLRDVLNELVQIVEHIAQMAVLTQSGKCSKQPTASRRTMKTSSKGTMQNSASRMRMRMRMRLMVTVPCSMELWQTR